MIVNVTLLIKLILQWNSNNNEPDLQVAQLLLSPNFNLQKMSHEYWNSIYKQFGHLLANVNIVTKPAHLFSTTSYMIWSSNACNLIMQKVDFRRFRWSNLTTMSWRPPADVGCMRWGSLPELGVLGSFSHPFVQEMETWRASSGETLGNDSNPLRGAASFRCT